MDWYLPGYKAGGPIRSVSNFIAHLKEEFEFSIVTRDADYCTLTPYQKIKSDEWNFIGDGTRVFYFSKAKLNYNNLKKILSKEKYDTLYLNSFFSFYFTILPLIILWGKKKSPKIILAPRGMLASTALQIKPLKKYFYLLLFNFLGLSKKIIFHASSEEEKNEIEKRIRKVKIEIAPNLTLKNTLHKFSSIKKTNGLVKLINIARIAPEKNLIYALEILKQVKGNVEFDFFGTIYNQKYWNECRKVLQELPKNIKANFRGEIEYEKIISAFQNYHFMLMPTLGENFGHIIFESLNSGIPVIISNKTPWKNLEEKKIGWDIQLNEKEKFISTIEKCSIMNQEEYNLWSENSFGYAKLFSENAEAFKANKKLFLIN